MFIKNGIYIGKLRTLITSKTAKDSYYVFAGNFLSGGLGILFTIFLARYLGVKQFGDFSIALLFMGLVSQITDLGITTGFIRYASLYINENPQKAAALIKATLKLRLIISLTILIFGYLTSDYIAKFIFNDISLSLLLKLSYIGAFGSSVLGYGTAILRSYEFFKKYSVSNLFSGILKIVALIFLVVFGFINLNNSFIVVITVPFISAILNYFLVPKNLLKITYGKNIEKEVMHELFSFSKWVMISSFATMLIMRLDAFMLKNMSNSMEVGYYAGAQRLAMVFPIITDTLTSVLLPKVSKISNNDALKHYIRKSTKITVFVIIPFVILQFISRPLVIIILGNSYENSVQIFKVLLIAYIFGIVVNPISLVIYNIDKNWVLTFVNLLQLILIFILNSLLIPSYGALGASIATTIIKVLGSVIIVVSVIYFIHKKGKS